MKNIFTRGTITLLGILLCGCGARDERHYDLAMRYKESGDYDRAISELHAAIKDNPRFKKAYNQLGVLYGKVGLYDKAADQFKCAVELDPSYASGFYNLGVLCQAHLNKPAEAVVAYQRYLALNPEGPRADAVGKIVQGLLQRPDVQSSLAESPDEQQLIAKRCEEKGEYESAIGAYKKAVAKEPRAASRAHLKIARIYEEKLDKPEEALKYYQAYLDANINAPDAADVMAIVGRLRERTGVVATPAVAMSKDALREAEKLLKGKEAGRAIAILTRARDETPEDDQVHDLLAEAFMSSGDLKGAEKEYEWLKSRQPDFAYGAELVSVYSALGDESLKSGECVEAGERFSKALELTPNSGALHWKLARALAGGGKFQKALDEAAIAKKLAPGEVSEGALADLYLHHARYLVTHGQYELAAEALEEVRRLAPGLDLTSDMADQYEGRARRAQGEAKFSDAERDYLKALQLDPTRVRVHGELAAIYERLGQYDRALQELETVAKGGPDGASAYKEIARIQETYKSDSARAASYYRKYLKALPKAADAKEVEKKLKAGEREKEQIVEYEQVIKRKPANAPSHYNLAVLLQRQGKFREAIDEYRRALALEPTNPQAHFNLGYSYDRLKMYEEAIGEYRKAIQYKPDYLKAYSNLAAIYKDKRWYGRAIATFQKALEIDPAYAHAHLGLGSIYAEGLRDRQKALSHYQQYLRLQPDGMYAPQVRAWMRGKT
jgi:tetratricopeptide (TPR) repeat protein